MRGWVLSAVLGGVFFSVSVQAQDGASFGEAERVGTALFELDRAYQAALKAGEELRSFRRDDSVTGWVSELRGETFVLTFVGQEKNGLEAKYRVLVNRSGRVLGEMERLKDEALSSSLLAQYRASQTTANIEHEACSATEAVMVLPNASSAPADWTSYLLPRPAFADIHIVGGHYRAQLSEGGNAVRSFTRLGEGCAVMPNAADATVLQLNDEQGTTPNEVHVYINRIAKKPIELTTPHGTWLISEGRISAR